MSEMPNREDGVRAIVSQPLVSAHFGTEDGRRIILTYICDYLNDTNDGKWGLLLKTERNPMFIPADCIVWKDTLEHVDVLTDSGPIWHPHPVIQPSWRWLAAPAPGTLPVPPDVEPEPPPPPVPGDPGSVLARVGALEKQQEEILKQIGKLNETDGEVLAAAVGLCDALAKDFANHRHQLRVTPRVSIPTGGPEQV